MGKNNENENVHVERQDNTQVRRPVLQKRVQKASPAKQIESYLKIYGVPQQYTLSADTRTPEQKETNRKVGELELYRQKREEQKQAERQLALGLGTTAAVIGSQFTPAAPYVNAALAAHSGVNLAEQYHEGTLGFNTETALNTLGFTPYGIKVLPYVSKAGAKAGEYLGKAGTYIREQSPIFIPAKNSFTRGIGRGTEGITDLVNSGVVRGNPRGTEVTAHQFAKLWRNNRLHFQDIMKDTGIPNIEQKFFSRNLNKEEFNAIKNAASKYSVGNYQSAQPVSLRIINPDPLSKYNSYDDYIKSIQQQVSEVESMTGKIKSGEVKVNTKLQEHENELPTGAPIEERFGPNSDYVGDGYPLTYWYPDGRNPFRRGYDYAGSDWGVRVLNADTQTPFMHKLHEHPSFFYTPRLDSPNVQVFRRLPFGLGLRVPKNWVRNKFKTINSSNAQNITDAEWDAAYNAALKNNDVAELQRLRKLHFIGKTPNNKAVNDKQKDPLMLYHGTDAKFNVFDENYIGIRDLGYFGRGFYFSPNKNYASNYGNTKQAYVNITNPIITDANDMSLMGKNINNNDGVLVKMGDDLITLDDKITTNSDELFEVLVSKPYQIKSARSITYDDSGKIIPLSKRDNFTNPDIRFGWLAPLFGVSASASLVNSKTKNKQ